jgi:hypothetical protein
MRLLFNFTSFDVKAVHYSNNRMFLFSSLAYQATSSIIQHHFEAFLDHMSRTSYCFTAFHLIV